VFKVTLGFLLWDNAGGNLNPSFSRGTINPADGLARSAVLIQFSHQASVLLGHGRALMTMDQVFLKLIVCRLLTRRTRAQRS
jgi:hypothetical protein